MQAGSILHAGFEPYPGCRLRRLLGQGGFSQVWEGEINGGPSLALKFMECANSSAAAREIRSIQKLRALDHPHLVRTERIWCHQHFVVIAMELADGDLNDLYHAYQVEFGTPIVPEQACMYLSQVALALDFLNTRQHSIDGRLVSFQHCDVKPGNMLLFGETAKLSDFGLAVQTSTANRMLQPQGTTAFAAPEVFQGQLSNQSDQYALAISYCLLRGGRLPFPEIDSFRASWPRRRPPMDLSMLSSPERPILTRALSPAPIDRWPSCQAMMEQLTQLFLEGQSPLPG